MHRVNFRVSILMERKRTIDKYVKLELGVEINNDEQIESSRIKREGVPENRDLTVLLVNQKRNDYNTKIGRYHSVKPLIGLLTSTARTFIQDGVTTEYATQILGTTLDNGRIYAQLLTKSSLVLYNKPTNVEDPVIVKPTRVHSAFDGEWNVKQDLGFIDPEKFVLKNTDYLAPNSKMEIVYASKPAQDGFKFWSPSAPESQADNQIFEEPTGRRVQPVKEIPRYVQNEALNFLDGPSIDSDKKFEFVVEPSIVNNVNTFNRQSKAYEPVTEPIKEEPRPKPEVLDEVNVVKVKPTYDLPTFTIKNEFSPIFYYIDNVESRRPQQQAAQQTKIPKKLFGQKSEPRPKKTFTYAGFADFTTVVGDTVIIFSPNTETSRPQNPNEVNVFPSANRIDKLSTKITFLAADIPVASSTYKAHEATSATRIPGPAVVDENRSDKALFNDEESLKKVLYEVDDKIPDVVSVQYNNGFGLNVDVIQPSESPMTTTESTRTTDDLGVIPINDYSNSEATEPLATLSPTTTILEAPKESAVTESEMTEVFTNSEEESENTAAEITEKPEEEEEEEDEVTTEMSDFMTTTESGHSEESSEEIETTTESKFTIPDTQEDSNEDTLDDTQEVICTEGFETQSTMTTAYKTLTYLTTYFIPLESTETTTSIKSDVVVESNTGFLTNVVCRTNMNIEPTAVVNVDYSVETKSKIVKPVSEEPAKPPTEPDVVTESPKTTTQRDEVQTVQDEQTTGTVQSSNETEETVEEKETTTTPLTTTTTERITTSQGHVEVSVSTEQTTTTTTTEKATTPEEVEESENEIDVIYKTLYTTYTYFTTFFGDQTSSVASHKSVVTNIITSTIDLSKLDPSLFGAFNEDEIAPTSVGIGRPTEIFAINSAIDLVKNKDVLESVEGDDFYNSQTPTPSLGDDIIASIKPDAVKTYYTTYTFFTTIYVGNDANICSRNEVYTNYVGPDELIPTKANPLAVENTRAQFDFRNCKQIKMEQANLEETASMETSVSMEEDKIQSSVDSKPEGTPDPSPIEVDMLFSVESNPLESENSYVTDIKSSSSKGERKFLDNNNIILDDQISSESNIEEILPSPTLLLQTSYTTFTYFTTMYIGKDSSKVKSRLETITNVVTETIMPNKEPEEESNLPITYYTTFTYWTTLYKDKSTTITSREEIVSNVVTPVAQSVATISPIDTTPIDVDTSLPPKDLEVELKPSLVSDNLEPDDGKATFYTTYTYFTTFYAGNTSQVRSSLETVTNIVDNTKLVEDNQLGRKVPVGAADQNLIQDNGEKPHIAPTVVKEQIIPTKLPDASSVPGTVLLGTYIDNLFAEVKPADKPSTPAPEGEKKILFSQVAVISGDSTVVTSDNKSLTIDTTSSTTTTTESNIISPTPEVIESSVAEPEPTTETPNESEEEEDDSTNTRKKSRLTFTPKKPSTTPVIIPFASRNRPTFIPKRVPLSSGATTITRADFTPPVITATPSLKSVKTSGFGGNRKQTAYPGSSSAGKRFPGRASANNPSANAPQASRPGGFAVRGSIQPTSRRTGFRSSSGRPSSLDYINRSAAPRVRPTASSRLPPGRVRPSASITFPPDQNDETLATQQEENATEALEEVSEAPARTTNNPLLRFRRPPVPRQPGTAITPRSTTASSRRAVTPRGRLTTTTRRSTTRTTSSPLLSLRRNRPNALFPRRNLFRQPEPEPEEEIKEDEQKVEDSEEILEEEEFEEDNDYDSSDRKERQVAQPPPATAPRRNIVQIRPFAFKRRTKRQADYGSRKYTNFRRPGTKTTTTRRPEPETEEPTTQKVRPGNRYNGRSSSAGRTTTAIAPKSNARQPFVVRGETRTTTTTSTPAYRRGKSSRPSSRTTTTSTRPKPPKTPKSPRLNKNSSGSRASTSRSSGRNSRTRTTTSRANSRQRSSFENFSGERFNVKNILNDGKITITHQIPTEVTVPIVNGKITEYKNLLSATPRLETLLLNQVSTSFGPLGNPQLVLAAESTELADNGATKIIKYLLHETPTTTVIFTPTTIRGRKTSFSHILPSTVYNVEPVTQTIAPEINSNVPLANLLLSQLLLGNQQPAINPFLALQGQGLIPQQPIVQTPVTEYKTRTTTYVTTVTDARETVLPITFRGQAILTTIVDPTTNVITATEFVTDTVVTTPTVAQAPQLNSLLLPLLLQQQQQQQQPALNLQTANPLLGLGQADLAALGGLNNFNNLNLSPNLNHQNNLNNDIYSNSPKPNILSDLNSNEDFSEDSEGQDVEEDLPPPPPAAPSRRKSRPKPAAAAAPVGPPKHTSVVTLYVSGRHPGEFSTVLSTVVSDDTQTVRKREAIYYDNVQVLPSLLPTISELSGSYVDGGIVTDSEKYFNNASVENQVETQSLESIVGEVSKHIRTEINDNNYHFNIPAFNSNGIVYDNTPWRPGRDMDLEAKEPEEDERRLKNLATRIMSNGVEVLVKDKNADAKQEQRKLKLIHATTLQPYHSSSSASKQLLSSAVATVVSRQQISALFPLHQLMQHNYIIKTCMTTYTYLTTVVQNKRSAISTFETIVSVVTTESLTNLYDTDVIPDLKPTKVRFGTLTKYMEVKTIQPSAATNMYMSTYPKIDKRIDSAEDDSNSFDLIQPSEVSNPPCASSCSCSNTKTEGLQTKFSNINFSGSSSQYGMKTTNYGATKLDLRPTNKESTDKKTKYGPYEYETNSHLAPTDKVVEKYTEVINDYSDEKDSNSVEESELLTNEQAPAPPKTNKVNTKVPEKTKPDKPQKPNKNKFVVADLLKLGTLGIKGLTQLAPVIEKMTGGFIKRQDTLNKTTSTTVKPAVKLTAYTANKRVDNDLEGKHNNFPIYIPVDELETSESQLVFTNATLHQNLAWAAEHKQPKAHIVPPKIVHESPLVNGGIPISPGEIITANSDVIVGKPAVGGPLTLAASGIKLQNSVNPPPIDSFIAANEQYFVNEKPLSDQPPSDDSYDLRPPDLPKPNPKPNRPMSRPMQSFNVQNSAPNDKYPYRMPASIHDHLMKTEQIKTNLPVLNNHGRPAFLDYIPSLAKPTNAPIKHNIDFKPVNEAHADSVPDNSPSSSEVVNTQIRTEDSFTVAGNVESNKPFLVDIQPSRVANVLIPHGSSTALVFAGSSEPHKTGDYIDDPLPYPEPGYFGSFSIDAPQMTNVHNVPANTNKQYVGKPNVHPPLDNYKPNLPPYKDQSHRNDLKIKWKDNKRPIDYNKIPPPTSNQETHVQVGPQITVYDPEVYNPNNGDFEKYNKHRGKDKPKDGKEVIDKEYENYLAVPPPPQQVPQKQYYNQDNIYDKSKPYSQRPIVHTKPVQDMKVFLNIQHPVPEQLPPKVTSEIYFAAQMPNSKPTPTYTIRIPPASPNYNTYNQATNNMQPPKVNHVGSIQNTFSVISSPNIANKSFVPLVSEDKDNTYTVTLNTATNVASNNEAGQVIGSSVAVPVGTSTHVSQLNTDIPIGTNFAIRVEDNTSPLESYNLQVNSNKPTVFNDNTRLTQVSVGDNRWNKSSTDTIQSTIVGNSYNNQNYGNKNTNYQDKNHYTNHNQHNINKNQNYASTNQNQYANNNQNTEIKDQNHNNKNQNDGSFIQNNANKQPTHENKPSTYENKPSSYSVQNQNFGNVNYANKNQDQVNKDFEKPNQNYGNQNKQPSFENQYQNYGDKNVRNPANPPIPPSLNSHANFPMMNDYSTSSTDKENVKPVTEYPDNVKSGDVKRPAKLIPNIPTNSHGWYSSVLNENNIVNNIKVEATTRKIIPLIHDYNEKNNSPHFGQKITSVGKPPTELWSQNGPTVTGFNIGKPFTKPQTTEKPLSTNPPFTTKPFNINYIPSNLGGMRQPAYDIPIRDNSDETTTAKIKVTTDKIKPVYENSEEIYDGEDEPDNEGEIDGEVSSESMKIPVVSASSEIDSKSSTEITLLQDEVFDSPKNEEKGETNKVLVNFNPGTQTEKPFSSYNNTGFQSNTIKPIYENNPYNKPRPFTINTAIVLDHQLQQPHWQINHMMENATNASYEDNIDLNIGEEMDKPSKFKPTSSSNPLYVTESNTKYKRPSRPVFANRFNNTQVHNESIITSTVHIQDKKPLIVEKATEKTTLPTFTLSNLELNRSSSEIIDLSPPPPTMDYNFKPSTNDEMIMGMSPPPPRTPPGIRLPTRVPLTPRPAIPIRTPPPYRTKPPRPVPPRVTTQRPVRKPVVNRDEISTYRPAFDIINNIRRPTYNRDQPSSQLLPPPRDIPSRVVSPVEVPAPTVSIPDVPKVVFPTPISSGWLTSSGIDFSSSFNFNPTSIQFPESPEPSKIPDSSEVSSSSENSYSYETESSSERVHDEASYEKPITDDRVVVSKESGTDASTSTTTTTTTAKITTPTTESSEYSPETSQEETTTDKMKVIPLGNKNRTRKPYPVRIDEKKTTTSKYKIPPKPTSVIKPTRTLSRPEILYPTRHTSIRKVVRPITRVPPIIPTGIIESSESSIDEDFIRPTEVLKENTPPTIAELEVTSLVEREPSSLPSSGSNSIPSSIPTPSVEEITTIKPTHHAGNEVKISDEIIPTKTEFRTTVVTLTKTLSEPPKTVSSIGYVNLTHTLTVTHTKTSLVSQSEGAVTQTLILTNTQTSTIVDVVTEVHTQVQPTTIIETVTKHIPIQVQPTPVQEIIPKTKVSLDDITMSSEENDNLIIRDTDTTDNIIQKIENDSDTENDNDTFFVVMNKSQNGGQSPPVTTDIETGDYDVTRNEQVNNNGVSQVLFGEILLAGTPYLETTNVNPNGVPYGKECQPDCKASRNERCQRIDGLMKSTYTYSVKLALGSQGNERLEFHDNLSDNSSKEYHALAVASHEGINRMIMQSDLRDVYHGVHINGFHPVEMKNTGGDLYQGVMNDFYVQLSDNAHESRLKEVIEKYLRNNNYSLGGTEVHAASELMEKLDVSDFDECVSGQFHDCSEHAQCFNLRGTYTCSCLEGFADLSVNALYPGRICSAEPVGCERCNYHGACYSRDDRRVLCECFQWYAGSSCQINLKVVLISLVVCGALLTVVLAVCAVMACTRRARRAPHPQRSIVACIQSMPSLHQGAMPKQRADRRALISERGESGDNSSIQNASLPYIPAKRASSSGKKGVMSDPPAHDPPPPPAPAVMIPRARLHPHHGDSRENIARKRSLELSSEAKLISYLESGASTSNDEAISAGFKVSTTVRPDEAAMKEERDDLSSVTKGDLEAELARFDTLRKSYSQEDLSEWTDAERRLGELTLSEARSVGGTLPASTGRAASSTRLTHQEHTMAERDLGSTFLLPHVHLYKPDLVGIF
ncbi:hypothetical protein HF086_010857 [Spodoptera exigua]|uniref:63 kDa sperm flagellar membrane protein n=1 Tax=Spodoptera exigua TaxID=7107 RepID=A0A922MCF2_SPOEX|nr:hypothetical protein HF086_010857 [Spodoptera exigua]